MNESLYEFYKTSEHFRKYVDAYCSKHHKGIFEALSDAMVQNVANDFKVRNMGII